MSIRPAAIGLVDLREMRKRTKFEYDFPQDILQEELRARQRHRHPCHRRQQGL